MRLIDPVLRWCFACLALMFLIPTGFVSAAVTVHTHDGREITGEVDIETDESLLWIRQEKEQILLTTAVVWEEIVAVHDGEKSLPLDQLRERLREQSTGGPKGFLLQGTVEQAVVACESCGAESPVRVAKDGQATKVRSLEIEAYLVNLDRDVEPDGLELVIAAVDENGMSVPVSGSLYVRLWGERIQPHGSLVGYEDLQRWSKGVNKDDFDADRLATYRLRFRTVRPEFDVGLHADALVNVRLSVRGQGNFEASVPVQIRKFNPVRDRLQLTRGGRFFPDELTQGTRHQLPHRTHTRQLRTR